MAKFRVILLPECLDSSSFFTVIGLYNRFKALWYSAKGPGSWDSGLTGSRSLHMGDAYAVP